MLWGTRAAAFASQCGTSGVASDPPITPGLVPHWALDNPPTTAAAGTHYQYRFRAGGDPKPTYSLFEPPSWLSINPTSGVVAGSPPNGTTSFTYSVVAGNGVGDEETHPTDVEAGPFTVDIE